MQAYAAAIRASDTVRRIGLTADSTTAHVGFRCAADADGASVRA